MDLFETRLNHHLPNLAVRIGPTFVGVHQHIEGKNGREKRPVRCVVQDEIVTGVNFALTPLVFGSISGTVYSADSLPIPHAVVDARLEDGYFHMTARTDENGQYIVDNLIQGSYLMRALVSPCEYFLYSSESLYLLCSNKFS